MLQAEPHYEHSSYTLGHQGDKMIGLIVVLTLFFIFGSISPLLVTEDMRDIVMMEHS